MRPALLDFSPADIEEGFQVLSGVPRHALRQVQEATLKERFRVLRVLGQGQRQVGERTIRLAAIRLYQSAIVVGASNSSGSMETALLKLPIASCSRRACK